MPRKAKEKIDENVVVDEVKEPKTAKKDAKKSTTTKKKTDVKEPKATKKVASKKTPDSKEKKKASTEKKATSSKSIKSAEKKSTATVKEPTTKKSTSKKSADIAKKETSTTKKAASKKSTSTEKKSTTKKKTTTKKSTKKTDENIEIQILEYYDLPYKYGNTIVKLLAQTPKTLFVYWEISDEDIANFKKQYGDDFFNITKPVLVVHNLTLDKTSEVEINDFANCWYLNTEDAGCKFDIELARKFIQKSTSKKVKKDDYLSVAKSNDLQAPNDHIMFEKLTGVVTFKNHETNETVEENIESYKFLKDIYKFYKNMYKDELLKNPSSKF